jgi:hypothetical protein
MNLKPTFLTFFFFAGLISLGLARLASAQIIVDTSDSVFLANVNKELDSMREGTRGLVMKELLRRLDEGKAITTISPVTADERTWHPNDRRGTRSHVIAQDTKLRGTARTNPTNALVYLHPSRADSSLSLFKLGTFAQMLAVAMDLNQGTYSGDFRIQEKRSMFFRNGWRDSLKLELISLSDRVPTTEYADAKKAGLLVGEMSTEFPILDVAAAQSFLAPDPSPLPEEETPE